MIDVKPLKEIASFIRTGKTPPTKQEKYFNGEINWYSPGDLDKTKFLFNAKRTITQLAIDDKKAITYPKNTLLIGCIGNIGKLGITSELSSSNQQLTGVLPNNNTDVNYLFYWFYGNKKVLESYSNNAVVPILNNRTLETIKIPLPPLDQQKKIAAILDAADAYRQKTKALIEKYDELTQSLFLDMFGDPVTNPMGFEISTVGNECNVKGGKRVPKGEKLIKEVTNHPYIKAQNIKNGFINENKLEYLTDELAVKLKRYIVNAGDVCITVVGVNIGDIGITPNSLHLANLTENANKLLIKDQSRLDNIYLAYYMMSDFVQRQVGKRTMAVGVPKLALFRIQQIDLLVPPFSLQQKFKDQLASLEAQKAQAQASLAQAEDLFNSLLQRAFKGELTS